MEDRRMSLRKTISRIPKVELHLHLDCSLSYAVVARLDPSITWEQYVAEFIAPQKCASLADFLTRAPRGFQLMQTREALQLVTSDLFEQLAKDSVIYAEIRFAPLLHTAGGLSPQVVVEIIDRVIEDCIRDSGMEARVILCCLRHFTRKQSLATARLVQEFRGSRVVALDLAGDEAGYPIDAHVAAFRYAIEHGLHRTAHAGEGLGAASVRETLKVFQPSRIGHGVRSVEDAQLIEELRRKKIHLEVCPSSNLQTDVCQEYGGHPIDRLFRAGVSVGVNTDARTITNITLNEEYARLSQHFGWKLAEFSACNSEALGAAFVEQPVKERLAVRLAAATDDLT
jgi:adenosine deaminase